MKNDFLVDCVRMDDFGRGICFLDGKIVFVPDFFPGEKAIIKINNYKNKYMLGEVLEFKKKSLDRVCGECKYNLCGCSLKNLDYSKTLEYKIDRVNGLLKKIGGIDYIIKNIEPSLSIYNYRNKITLKVKNGKIGYYKNNSNDLIEIDECLIASKNINEIVRALNKEDLSDVVEVVIKDMNQVMIIIKGNMKIDNLKKYADSIYINDKLIYGMDKITNSILGYNFLVSKDSFFQVNDGVTEKLYSKVLEYAGEGDKALDLYCGTGTISLFLSKNFNNVIGVEINREAVMCANENKKSNNINNVDFICEDANKFSTGSVDIMVVDPARAGIMKEGIQNIINIKPKKIVYVSCNPVTLARDLKMLDSLYNISDITLFDMFPWTYHIETVCLLTRKVL